MLKRFLALSIVILALSLASLAQTKSSKAQYSGTSNDAEVAFGYAHLTPQHNGFDLSAAKEIQNRTAIEGNFGAYFDHGDTVTTFTAGPKYNFKNIQNVTPWVHAFMGYAHESYDGYGDGAFAWGMGGGVDYKFTKECSGRFKVDMMGMNSDAHARVGFSVVYKF